MLCADVLASTASILNLSVISLDRKAGGGGKDSHIRAENLIFGPLLQPKMLLNFYSRVVKGYVQMIFTFTFRSHLPLLKEKGG